MKKIAILLFTLLPCIFAFGEESKSLVVVNPGETISGLVTHVHMNSTVTAELSFKKFESVEIGRGLHKFSSNYWVTIDKDTVRTFYTTYKNGKMQELCRTAKAHGLSIKKNMSVSISCEEDNRAQINIKTSSGTYSAFIPWYTGGPAYLTNTGSNPVQASVDLVVKDMGKPIWVFGDSYIGWRTPSRWAYYVYNAGVRNIMYDHQGGAKSTDMLEAFKNDLTVGSPQYAVWCLGMNDGYDDKGLDPTWLKCIKEFIAICEKNDITPILATIPSVPKRYHALKAKWVRESGYQYIDFSASVTENDSREWYEGYLSNDNVHPAEPGAAAQGKVALEVLGNLKVSKVAKTKKSSDPIWLEAEDFANKGSWVVETQFTHKMGSAYLLCPGKNIPTDKPATTTIRIPKTGKWQVWARTKDWLPEFSPGKFSLVINGEESMALGASKAEGWHWEKAGTFKLAAGTCNIELKDLSGAYSRCDAIVLTTDMSFVPAEETSELYSQRAFLSGTDLRVRDGGTYDVVVIGAGPGGMGSSLAAAREGADVALVFDRPVPGGNASSECGVSFRGASVSNKNARESGIMEEMRLARRYLKKNYTETFDMISDGEPNLHKFNNERVMSVVKDGSRITSVISRNTLTGKLTRWSGKIFIDSTGDGWIAYYAGARMMYGREAGSEFNEEWIAPKEADNLTMSGTLLCSPGKDVKHPVSYETPEWARIMPEGFDRKVKNMDMPWWLEAPGTFDDIEDPEKARDHLIRIHFAYFGWLKNEWEGREKVADYEIKPPTGFVGRREGMRIIGDYILTANDCLEGRLFEDRVSYGGWSLDTHDPLGMDNPHGDGWWHPHKLVPVYSVPFRSLYSADIDNLLIGSRCQSMTHMALGSMRVQATQVAAGQAAGTAAAMCVKYGVGPRELGKTKIDELQQILLRNDQYIPGLVNHDPADLARLARTEAKGVIDGISRPVGDDYHGWVSESLPASFDLEFDKEQIVSQIRLTFDSDLNPQTVKYMHETLVKDYQVEIFDGNEWKRVIDEKDNYLRHRIHDITPVSVEKVRVSVTRTWGDPCARVFEIRLY